MNKAVFPSTKTNTLAGPLKHFVPMEQNYNPVDCDFTDELEFVSIKKIMVEVGYWGVDSVLHKCHGFIIDILTQGKEEFIIMSDGEMVRLDRIHQIRMVFPEQ